VRGRGVGVGVALRRVATGGRVGCVIDDRGFGVGARRDRFPRHTGAERRRTELDLVGVIREREHHAVTCRTQQLCVDTRERGADARDLVLHSARGLEVEVDTETRRQLARDPPAFHRGPPGVTLARDALHTTLEVRRGAFLLTPDRDGQARPTSLRRRRPGTRRRRSRVDGVDGVRRRARGRGSR
jgi:hypothetical protein